LAGGKSVVCYNTIHALEKASIHFYIEMTRPDTLRLNVSLVGERIEIEVFEDEHLEISRFRGDESVEGGEELLRQILSTL
jgi:hypothetical protein